MSMSMRYLEAAVAQVADAFLDPTCTAMIPNSSRLGISLLQELLARNQHEVGPSFGAYLASFSGSCGTQALACPDVAALPCPEVHLE